jgi:hypothetical protein
MRVFDLIILVILLGILGVGVYILWENIPGEPIRFKEFKIENKIDYENGTQFYANMRYAERKISYSVSKSCDAQRILDANRAFLAIDERTIIDFIKVERDGDINILCSNVAPEPDEEGHFVAGEGGPSEIINTSNFAVIFSGKVSLYRENECERPNVAIHEILHALGFDHNSNPSSVMYPVTECNQEIDNYIVDEINRLYSIESAVDLVVEKVRATKSGRFLNFEVNVGNFGLKDSLNSSLLIIVKGEKIKEYSLDRIDIGTRKVLEVENLRIPRGAEVVEFNIRTKERELNYDNNIAMIGLARE